MPGLVLPSILGAVVAGNQLEVRTRPLVRCTSECASVCSPPHSICASVLPSPPLYIEVFLPPRRQLICAHTHILSSVYGNAVSRSAIKCTVMLVCACTVLAGGGDQSSGRLQAAHFTPQLHHHCIANTLSRYTAFHFTLL